MRRIAALGVPALLLAVVLLRPAFAEVKKYGYDSKVGGGDGVAFSPAESTTIATTLTKIKAESFVTKEGTFKGSDIEKALRKMLEDGRMGKGDGARKSNAAVTKGDGKTTTDGDLMNIADHHIKDADNKHLANTLVHEWLHCTQLPGTEEEKEAPAYQLGRRAYLDKGGKEKDKPAKNDAKCVEKYKDVINKAKQAEPNSKVPAKGAERKRSLCGHEYFLDQELSRVFFWSQLIQDVDSIEAGPDCTFFTFLAEEVPGECERLMIFGTDRTDPSLPIGTLTTVLANESGFHSRLDLPLPGLMMPFSATRDTLNGDLYVLDAHFDGPGIVRLRDLDHDGFPEDLQTFAARGFPGVDSAEAVVWVDLGDGLPAIAVDELDRRGDTEDSADESLTLLRDLDLDGVADLATGIVELELVSFAPHFTAPLVPGDAIVELQAMPGHAIEIRLTDATGDANLGTIGAAIAGPGWEPMLVPISVPLSAGEFVKIVDLTDDTRAAKPTPVLAPVPATSSALLALLAAGLTGLGWIRLNRGRNFLRFGLFPPTARATKRDATRTCHQSPLQTLTSAGVREGCDASVVSVRNGFPNDRRRSG